MTESSFGLAPSSDPRNPDRHLHLQNELTRPHKIGPELWLPEDPDDRELVLSLWREQGIDYLDRGGSNG